MAATAAPSKAAASFGAGRSPVTLRRMRIEMGTGLVIEARAASQAQAEAAITAAFVAAAEIARRLDPWAADSDLWRLNRAVPGRAVPICRATLEVLRFAQHLSCRSDGVFDPCLPTRPGRVTDLELIDGAEPRAIVRRPLEVDCGGIAKGYAVDAAVAVLQKSGSSAGLVNAGGDLRIFGEGCEAVLLRGPRGSCRPLRLQDSAVAVSDRDMLRAPPGHRGYYVRTGTTAARRFAAVRAGSAMTADALTKCLLLAPRALTEALLKEFHSESLA